VISKNEILPNEPILPNLVSSNFDQKKKMPFSKGFILPSCASCRYRIRISMVERGNEPAQYKIMSFAE
jgi:hypothetical protein